MSPLYARWYRANNAILYLSTEDLISDPRTRNIGLPTAMTDYPTAQFDVPPPSPPPQRRQSRRARRRDPRPDYEPGRYSCDIGGSSNPTGYTPGRYSMDVARDYDINSFLERPIIEEIDPLPEMEPHRQMERGESSHGGAFIHRLLDDEEFGLSSHGPSFGALLNTTPPSAATYNPPPEERPTTQETEDPPPDERPTTQETEDPPGEQRPHRQRRGRPCLTDLWRAVRGG